MSSALRSVIAQFGVEVDSGPLVDFDKTVGRAIERLTLLGGAIAGLAAGKAFVGFIENQIESAKALENTAAKLGLSTDALQALDYAAVQSGVSVDKFNNALGFLERNQGKAEIGAKSATKEWARLGLSVKGADGSFLSLDEQLASAADKIAGMPDQAQRARAAMALFGRAGLDLLPVLQMGSEGMRAQTRAFKEAGGGLSQNYLKSANEARIASVKFDYAMDRLKATIVEYFLPAATSAWETLEKWGAKAKEVAERSEILWLGLKVLEGFIATQLIRTLWSLAEGMTAATWEFILVGIVLAGILLVMEDLKVAFEGGDSLIKKYLTAYEGADKAKKDLDGIKQSLDVLNKAVQESKGPIKGAFDEMFEAFKGALPAVIKGVALEIQGAAIAARFLVGSLQAVYHLAAAVGYAMTKGGDRKEAERHWNLAGAAIDHAGNDSVDKGTGFDKMTTADTTEQQRMFWGQFYHSHPELGGPKAYRPESAASGWWIDAADIPQPGSAPMPVNNSAQAFGPPSNLAGPMTVHNDVMIKIDGAGDPSAVANKTAGSIQGLTWNMQTSQAMGNMTPEGP
jgi:hypothetical protein